MGMNTPCQHFTILIDGLPGTGRKSLKRNLELAFRATAPLRFFIAGTQDEQTALGSNQESRLITLRLQAKDATRALRLKPIGAKKYTLATATLGEPKRTPALTLDTDNLSEQEVRERVLSALFRQHASLREHLADAGEVAQKRQGHSLAI